MSQPDPPLFSRLSINDIRLVKPKFDKLGAEYLKAEVCAIDAELDDGEEEKDKIAMVIGTDTGIDPGT